MWSQIERCVPIMAIVVCSGWVIGQSELGRAASISHLRLAQLKDGDSFYTQLGKAAVERGDNYRAVRLLTSAIKKGGLAQAFKYRSQAYERLGQHEKASADVDQYVQLKPRDPWGYTKRGTWYSLASQHDKAFPQFLRAVKLDPSFTAAHFGLGIAYTALERHESAIQEFNRVLDLEPDNNDALLNLGVALMLSGRASEARTTLSKALQGQEDARWKDRIELWIASLPSSAETKGPSVKKPPGRSDGPNPRSNSFEDSGSRRTGYDRRTGQDRISVKEPGTHEVRERPSSAGEPAKSQKASSNRSPIVLTGKWKTEYRGIDIGVAIRQVGEAITGVMTVDGPLMGSKAFPFDGTFRGGVLKGRSSEGHSFRGRVYRSGKVIGTLDINGGPTVPVSFNVSPGDVQPRRSGG
jgi:tetratricopeptide (TPR) repeat protein